MGYQDVIRVLYGYSFAEEAVVGIRVLESKETPGLGTRIETDPDFLWIRTPYTRQYFAQFAGDLEIVVAKCLEKEADRRYGSAGEFGADNADFTLSGHSVGAHLAAMALACLWPQAVRGLPRKLFQGALSISGVYDLRVLTRVPSINADLKMTLESAIRLSPALMRPPTSVPLSIAVA